MNDLKDTPEETDSPDSIICPYCLNRHLFPHSYLDGRMECHACEKLFHMRSVTTYHAKPVMEEKPASDFSGVNSPLNWKWTNQEKME